jgi:hypothetical protein
MKYILNSYQKLIAFLWCWYLTYCRVITYCAQNLAPTALLLIELRWRSRPPAEQKNSSFFCLLNVSSLGNGCFLFQNNYLQMSSESLFKCAIFLEDTAWRNSTDDRQNFLKNFRWAVIGRPIYSSYQPIGDFLADPTTHGSIECFNKSKRIR